MKLARRDNRLEVWRGALLVGYVEDDTLFAIVDGYAEQVGTIAHNSEIVGKLRKWFTSHRRTA